MSKIDEVAEAIVAKIVEQTTGALPIRSVRFSKSAREVARAAIRALREPSEAMVVNGLEVMKGNRQMCPDAYNDAQACWYAMIDALLREE